DADTSGSGPALARGEAPMAAAIATQSATAHEILVFRIVKPAFLRTETRALYYSVHAVRTRCRSVTQHTDGRTFLGTRIGTAHGAGLHVEIGNGAQRQADLAHGVR